MFSLVYDAKSMAKPKKSSGNKLTLVDVVNHMQHHFQRINERFDVLESKLDGHILEFRDFAKGVDDLDDRVQDIEEDVPKIKKKLKIAA